MDDDGLGSNPNNPASGQRRPGAPVWVILVTLFFPFPLAVLTLFAKPGDYGANSLLTLAIATPIAGIVAAVLFMSRVRTHSTAQKVAAGVGMALVFTIASLAVSLGGCYLVAASAAMA